MNNEALSEALAKGRLVVTAGSGGVGKTTVAAALAIGGAIWAERRVAVVTIDPARRLANAMGFDSMSGDLKAVSLDGLVDHTCRGSLHAMMLDVKTTSDAMVKRFSPDAKAAEAILKNPYYQHFAGALAGSQEYMAVEAVRSLLEDDQFDLVVLDTPPAVHALDFFDAPRRLIEGLESSPVRMLAKYGSQAGQSLTGRIARKGSSLMLKGLGRMAGGPFLEELAEFLKLFGGILEALKEASLTLEKLLRAEGVHFFLVLTPHLGSLESTLDFKKELAKRTLPFRGFILNKMHPGGVIALPEQDVLLDVLKTKRAGDLSLALADLEALKQFHQEEEVLHHRDRHIEDKLNRVSTFPVLCIPSMSHEVHDLGGLLSMIETQVGPLRTRGKI